MPRRAQNLNLPLVRSMSLVLTGGLVAAMSGTTNLGVLNFTGVAVIDAPTGAITSSNSATLGTTVGITAPGVYVAELGGTLGAAASCIMGISVDQTAGLTADPAFANAGTLAVLGATAPAATVLPFYLSATFTVRGNGAGQTGTPAGSILRFLGSNGAAGAPAGLTQASWFARLTKVGELA